MDPDQTVPPVCLYVEISHLNQCSMAPDLEKGAKSLATVLRFYFCIVPKCWGNAWGFIYVSKRGSAMLKTDKVLPADCLNSAGV